jgi:phage tail-like protein
MAVPAAQRPLVHFELTLHGHEPVGQFREVSGLDSETEVIEQASTDTAGNPIVTKTPGPTRWSDIRLRRPLDANRALWEWRRTVLEHGAERARVDGTISLLDEEGRRAVTFAFVNGWPARYAAMDLDASSDDVPLEEVVICHEGLRRI